jgi:hypothetical protein
MNLNKGLWTNGTINHPEYHAEAKTMGQQNEHEKVEFRPRYSVSSPP